MEDLIFVGNYPIYLSNEAEICAKQEAKVFYKLVGNETIWKAQIGDNLFPITRGQFSVGNRVYNSAVQMDEGVIVYLIIG